MNGLEREWEWKENFDWKYHQNLGTGREGNKSISKTWGREGKKNSIYKICEQESKALVHGNGREQEFPLGAYHAKTSKKTQKYM